MQALKRAAFVLLAAIGGAVSTAPAQDSCTIARTIDGDTLVCAESMRVRLLLIDAPELSQKPYGQQATEALAKLLPIGSVVGLELDVQPNDRYGRTLAHVRMPDGRLANLEMVRRGYAIVSVYPPNVRHVERFRSARDSARVARHGLWATDAFDCEPAEHRRGGCEAG